MFWSFSRVSLPSAVSPFAFSSLVVASWVDGEGAGRVVILPAVSNADAAAVFLAAGRWGKEGKDGPAAPMDGLLPLSEPAKTRDNHHRLK
jgi:hypothetical protein